MAPYSVVKVKNTKNWGNNRVLSLKIKDGTKPKSSTGLVDTSLFSGGNSLHAIQDAGLWTLKYAKGATPPLFRQKFTNFNSLLKWTTNYFALRNIEIKEVFDAPDA